MDPLSGSRGVFQTPIRAVPNSFRATRRGQTAHHGVYSPQRDTYGPASLKQVSHWAHIYHTGQVRFYLFKATLCYLLGCTSTKGQLNSSPCTHVLRVTLQCKVSCCFQTNFRDMSSPESLLTVVCSLSPGSDHEPHTEPEPSTVQVKLT